MEAATNKRSIWGNLSLIIAVFAFMVYFGAYVTDMEMAFILIITLFAAFLGIVIGAVGFIIALVQKSPRKGMTIIGLLLNLFFIVIVIAMFFSSMGGP